MSVPEQIKKISFLPLPLWTNLLRNRNSRWPLHVGIHS
ncbi:cyclic di-GMP phosphodiesterase Gmr domain protein [Escherichia coli P0304799.3]|nr:cyclic di-GMP phosphodiesterase Gmr domain protein [Escherichia coli P0304799.3]